MILPISVCDDEAMELRHFEYFIAVAEEMSFTGAARRLHVVQSGVSATIRALERELGAALFERSPQRVDLTDAGKALLPQAHAALDAVRTARDVVRGKQGLHGTIDIGVMTASSLINMPVLLSRFRSEHPAVTLRLRVSPTGSAGLAQSLGAGELDVAFLSLTGRAQGGLVTRRLASYPMVVLVPPGHRLFARTHVTLHELADEEFIDFCPGSSSRDLADRAFAAAGVHRQISVEVLDMGTAAACVQRGLGIALLPQFAVAQAPDAAVLQLSDRSLLWALSMATSSTRRLSAPARAFLDLVDDYASEELGQP